MGLSMLFSEYVKNSNNPVIIAKKIDSFDKASALLALYSFIKSEKPQATLIMLSKLPANISQLFKKHEVTYEKNVKPLNYEVWIDYGTSGIKKVTYDTDEKDKKLKFIITPGDKGFDFKKVEFKEGGSMHDLVILFDIDDCKDLNSFYEENDYLFRDIPSVYIKQNNTNVGDLSINVGDQDSFSEKIFEELKQFNVPLNKEVVELLLNGTINHRRILEGKVSSNSWSIISSMASEGGDINQTINDIYYSKSQENLNVQIKLMQNVKINREKKILWSGISKKDLDFYHVDSNTLDTRGRIQFNISKDFDLAFAVYEIEPNTLKVIIESNNPDKYSALDIAKIFNGDGDETHSECTINSLKLSDFEAKMFEVLDEKNDEVPPTIPDIVGHDEG